jgi:hypothetical protein
MLARTIRSICSFGDEMTFEIRSSSLSLVMVTLGAASALNGQGTLADYERAQGLQAKARHLVVNAPGAITWIGESDHFWYPRSVKGGTEFVLVDADAGAKKLAFDHDKLATAISTAAGHAYTGLALPFAPLQGGRGGGGRATPGAAATTAPMTFLDGEKSIQFGTGGSLYKCGLTEYTCAKVGPIPLAGNGGRGGRGTGPEDESLVSPEGPGGDPVDGLEYQPPAPQDGDEGIYGRAQRACAPQPARTSSSLARNARLAMGGQFPGQLPPEPPEVCASFDGKWEAYIQNFNVYVKPVGNQPSVPLSFDGSEGNYYTLRSIAWSPNSKKLAAYHTRSGYDRQIPYIESSPSDQLQPKHMTIAYRKPGDALDIAYPALFDLESKKETEIDHALFPNPYALSPPVWWKDSRG